MTYYVDFAIRELKISLNGLTHALNRVIIFNNFIIIFLLFYFDGNNPVLRRYPFSEFSPVTWQSTFILMMYGMVEDHGMFSLIF